jgi:hypothetical protein
MNINDYLIYANKIDTFYESSLKCIVTEYDKSVSGLNHLTGNTLNKNEVDYFESDLSDAVAGVYDKAYDMIHAYINKRIDLFNLYKRKRNLERSCAKLQSMAKNKILKNARFYAVLYNIDESDGNNAEDLLTQYVVNFTRYVSANNEFYEHPTRKNENKLRDYYVLYKHLLNTEYSKYITKMTIEDAISTIPTLVSTTNLSIIKLKKESISDYIKDHPNEDRKLLIVKIFNKIKSIIDKKIHIAILNIELLKYECNCMAIQLVDKEAKEYVLTNGFTKEEYKKIREASEPIGTISYGKNAYHIYKTPIPHMVGFILGGVDIFVQNDFFKLPKAAQLAILAHEVGHNESGHFFTTGSSSKYRADEEKALKIIAEDIKYFEKKTRHQLNCVNDEYLDYLFYLIDEWEADRYAIACVGKWAFKTQIYLSLFDFLNHDVRLRDDSRSELRKTKIYNKKRFKLRTGRY